MVLIKPARMHSAWIVLGVIIGTILSGWLCDRFGKRWPLAIYYTLAFVTSGLFALVAT